MSQTRAETLEALIEQVNDFAMHMIGEIDTLLRAEKARDEAGGDVADGA